MPGRDESLGPLRSQIWAAHHLAVAGISCEARGVDDGKVSPTAATVAAISDEAAMKEWCKTSGNDLKWPDDTKIFGFVVTLEAEHGWTIHFQKAAPKTTRGTRSATFADRNSFKSQECYEICAQNSLGALCFTLAFAIVVRITVLFRTEKDRGSGKLLTDLGGDEESPGLVEARVDCLFCNPYLPLHMQVRFTFVSPLFPFLVSRNILRSRHTAADGSSSASGLGPAWREGSGER